jgi:hypothetical protein
MTRLIRAIAIVAWFGYVSVGYAHFENSWEELLEKTKRHLGNTWCGTIDGHLHIGSRVFVVSGYQFVLPRTEELVIQLVPANVSSSEIGTNSRLLRIAHKDDRWNLQETGREPRSFIPSEELKQSLRWGMAYGLSPFQESMDVIVGDQPPTFQLQTKKPMMLLPGMEGKIRMVMDRGTGKLLTIQAFGLREWQGREIQDYKLGMNFHFFPGCEPPSPKNKG